MQDYFFTQQGVQQECPKYFQNLPIQRMVIDWLERVPSD